MLADEQTKLFFRHRRHLTPIDQFICAGSGATSDVYGHEMGI